MLQIKRFIFNPFLENTYIVFDDITRDSTIIDPGCYDKSEEELLSKFIIENKLSIKYLINTHCHIDHILGNAFVKNNYDCTFYAPEKDLFLLNSLNEQSLIFGLKAEKSPLPDFYITEESTINIGNSEVKFLYTPGHTPGEYSLYFENEKICFTGDVLFNKSIGRTDLDGGDYDTLINSITTKLFVLPDDVTIYPGHEEKSSIGEEKRNNPFFQN